MVPLQGDGEQGWFNGVEAWNLWGIGVSGFSSLDRVDTHTYAELGNPKPLILNP